MIKFKEIETKYSASNIKLSAFKKAAAALEPIKYVEPKGNDYYFSKKGSFTRYRAGDLHELTKKVKTKRNNNYVRTEVNMPITPQETEKETFELVEAFVKCDGYVFDFSIFKSCFIYYYPTYNLVYYVVYDTNMKEVSRFIEIEMLEHYPWLTIEDAWNELLGVEKYLSCLGLNPKRRVRESLFEMFKSKGSKKNGKK